MGIDWKKITGNKNITEFSRIVETCYVTPKRNTGLKIKIEVLEYPEGYHPGGNYKTKVSHLIWTPDQKSPYTSTDQKESIAEAINASIAGLYEYDSDKFPNDVVFYVAEDIHRICKYLDYIDGNGNSVTEKEAKKRRSDWREKQKKLS